MVYGKKHPVVTPKGQGNVFYVTSITHLTLTNIGFAFYVL